MIKMADKENKKAEEEAKEAKKAKAEEKKDTKVEETESTENTDESIDEDGKVIAAEDVDALESVPNPDDLEEELKAIQRMKEAKDAWTPKTSLGRQVKSGEIDDIDPLLDAGIKILEPEITEFLLRGLETDLLLIGQSKGKFGGGQRRVFRQTQKKTREGNKPQFATIAVIGDKNGHVGIGYGKSRETVPAREKAIRKSKLNIFKVRRGSGSWESAATEPNSIPFKVTGSCGSTTITLIPAPKGTGLCVEKECAKILALAGIQDIWAKTSGQTKTKINLIMACEDALRKLSNIKILPSHVKDLSIVEGSIKGASNE
jgi:small subunit ribosomal protein S5